MVIGYGWLKWEIPIISFVVWQIRQSVGGKLDFQHPWSPKIWSHLDYEIMIIKYFYYNNPSYNQFIIIIRVSK